MERPDAGVAGHDAVGEVLKALALYSALGARFGRGSLFSRTLRTVARFNQLSWVLHRVPRVLGLHLRAAPTMPVDRSVSISPAVALDPIVVLMARAAQASLRAEERANRLVHDAREAPARASERAARAERALAGNASVISLGQHPLETNDSAA